MDYQVFEQCKKIRFRSVDLNQLYAHLSKKNYKVPRTLTYSYYI